MKVDMTELAATFLDLAQVSATLLETSMNRSRSGLRIVTKMKDMEVHKLRTCLLCLLCQQCLEQEREKAHEQNEKKREKPNPKPSSDTKLKLEGCT